MAGSFENSVSLSPRGFNSPEPSGGQFDRGVEVLRARDQQDWHRHQGILGHQVAGAVVGPYRPAATTGAIQPAPQIAEAVFGRADSTCPRRAGSSGRRRNRAPARGWWHARAASAPHPDHHAATRAPARCGLAPGSAAIVSCRQSAPNPEPQWGQGQRWRVSGPAAPSIPAQGRRPAAAGGQRGR